MSKSKKHSRTRCPSGHDSQIKLKPSISNPDAGSTPLITWGSHGIHDTTPTISATMPKTKKHSLRILQLVCPGAKLLDVSGPLQVFHIASKYTSDGRAYETLLISQSGGSIVTDVGISLPTTAYARLQLKSTDIIVVTGGDGIDKAAEDQGLIAWLHAQAPKCRALASTCTGAFLLGAAGFLDNRRAVTHWMACQRLQSQYPEARVESDPIFIEDDGVWTSAGVTAGIDLALAMVQSDSAARSPWPSHAIS